MVKGTNSFVNEKDIKNEYDQAVEITPWMASAAIESLHENGIETIGSEAFSFCPINSLIIPSSVSLIGLYPMRSCLKLKSIEVDPLNPFFKSEEGVLFDFDKTTLIQYPEVLLILIL